MIELSFWKLLLSLFVAFIGGCGVTLSVIACIELRGIAANAAKIHASLSKVVSDSIKEE